MRIEITIEGQEPAVFPLTQVATTFGSAPDCDLVVEADGISPHHLTILMEGDQFFVTDLGSESGSFVNDEQITPGERVEFTSFFPVRLGGIVTLALLSDEEEAAPSFDFAQDLVVEKPKPVEEKTVEELREEVVPVLTRKTPGRTIETSLNSRRSPTPSMPKAKKAEGSKKSKAPDEASQTKVVQLLAFLVAFGGAGVFYLTRSIPEELAPEQTQASNVAVVQAPPPLDLATVSIDFERPEGLSAAASSLTAQKCFSPEEQALCTALRLPLAAYPLSGVMLTSGSVNIVLPAFADKAELLAHYAGQDWFELIKDKVPETFEPRDLIVLALLEIPHEEWAKMSQGRRWLYVTQVTANGQSAGPLWLANLSGLKSVAGTESFAAELKGRLSIEGFTALAPIAGFFREAEP